ncbi:glycosyltransferase family 2 protein [Amycolatopsis sp. NPDC051106]|uniref:glycosyltransferase family 2 protein n=1 Tax=unclassified Amycolatopsis TaxID=2618356 RepID=UPI0034268591
MRDVTANPATTVVVVTWRGAGHVTACLDALAAQTRPHRTLVVDNASDDGTAALLAAHPSHPQVIRLPRNTGYAGALAVAAKRVDTPLMAWLNDDAEAEPDWLATLEDTLEKAPLAGAATSRLVRPDGSTQSAGVRLTADGHGADLTEPTAEVFGFCGGAALLRTDVLKSVHGVPAGFFCYYEDTDTAWRLRLAGWDVVAAPEARVRHAHGVSSELGSPLFHRWNERNRLLMLLRCAPRGVAVNQLVRFAVLTAVLPLRPGRPAAPNFRFGLRCRVLAEVVARLPATLAARRRIGRATALGRGAVWEAWAGL